jgi:hypothetical protein
MITTGEKWAVHLPFSIYLGWITVATVANISDVLDSVKKKAKHVLYTMATP